MISIFTTLNSPLLSHFFLNLLLNCIILLIFVFPGPLFVYSGPLFTDFHSKLAYKLVNHAYISPSKHAVLQPPAHLSPVRALLRCGSSLLFSSFFFYNDWGRAPKPPVLCRTMLHILVGGCTPHTPCFIFLRVSAA